METLSKDEFDILQNTVNRNQRTVYGELCDPIIISLCNKGLLKTGAGAGNPLDWAFIIPDFVYDRLKIMR